MSGSHWAGIDEIPGSRDDCFPVTKPPRVKDYVRLGSLQAPLELATSRAHLVILSNRPPAAGFDRGTVQRRRP
jgi:hypothetical protein